jgi:hypothetical protein
MTTQRGDISLLENELKIQAKSTSCNNNYPREDLWHQVMARPGAYANIGYAGHKRRVMARSGAYGADISTRSCHGQVLIPPAALVPGRGMTRH